MKLELNQMESEWLYAILKDLKPVSLSKDSESKYIMGQIIMQKMFNDAED